MGQLNILNVFFENPSKEFHIRGIAKKLNIPKTTVANKVNSFLRSGLLVKNEEGVFPTYKANVSGEEYSFQKKVSFLTKLNSSKLVDYLDEEFSPRVIILFGSFAKAEYDSESDIDIFVQAPESDYDLSSYENELGHKINLFFEPSLNNLSKELLNNILNGYKLRGFIRL